MKLQPRIENYQPHFNIKKNLNLTSLMAKISLGLNILTRDICIAIAGVTGCPCQGSQRHQKSIFLNTKMLILKRVESTEIVG